MFFCLSFDQNQIENQPSLGVLDQFDNIRPLLMKKYYDRLEQLAKGLRGYVYVLFSLFYLKYFIMKTNIYLLYL